MYGRGFFGIPGPFVGEGGRATGEGPCGAQLIRRCGLLFRPVRGPVRAIFVAVFGFLHFQANVYQMDTYVFLS